MPKKIAAALLPLKASTYPLEVVQAERWLNANNGLKGDQLKEAVEKQPWDESVKSLIATPSVLEMMNSKKPAELDQLVAPDCALSSCLSVVDRPSTAP
jgi:hypothetical protein